MKKILKVVVSIVLALVVFVGFNYYNLLDKFGIGRGGLVNVGDVPEWVNDYNRVLLGELDEALRNFNEGESYYSDVLKRDFRKNAEYMRLFGFEDSGGELPLELKELQGEIDHKEFELEMSPGDKELESELETLEKEFDELYGAYIDDVDSGRDKNDVLTDKILSVIYLGSIRTDVEVDKFVKEYEIYLTEDDLDYDSDDFGDDVVKNMLIMLGPEEVYTHLQLSANDLTNIEDDMRFICDMLGKECSIEYSERDEREIYKIK